MPPTPGKTRPRIGVRVGALCVAGAFGAACGQVLGLDGIAYDPADGGSVPHDSNAPVEDGGADAAVDAPIIAQDGSAADQTSPPMDGNVAPPVPVTLATGPTGAQGLAIDATRIYWVAGGVNGSVLSILKDGGGMTTIATGQASPVDIAVVATSVYWSVTPSGTGPQCMAMVASTPGSVADGGDAGPSCVTSSPDVTVRMTPGGGGVVLLSQGTAAQANNEYVGFATPGTAYTNVETQGPSQAIVAIPQQAFLGNKNGDHVDEITLPGLTFGSRVCTTNCGTTVVVDMTADVTGENILWVTQGGAVFTAPVAVTASTGTQYGASLPATPQRMARDASYIYVTTTGQWVYAVPIAPGTDAGALVTLSADENEPFGIAADPSGVYWANANGEVRMMAVP